MAEFAEQSGCGNLLDMNDIYVNATNHDVDPHTFLSGVTYTIGQSNTPGGTHGQRNRRWGHPCCKFYDPRLPELVCYHIGPLVVTHDRRISSVSPGRYRGYRLGRMFRSAIAIIGTTKGR